MSENKDPFASLATRRGGNGQGNVLLKVTGYDGETLKGINLKTNEEGEYTLVSDTKTKNRPEVSHFANGGNKPPADKVKTDVGGLVVVDSVRKVGEGKYTGRWLKTFVREAAKVAEVEVLVDVPVAIDFVRRKNGEVVKNSEGDPYLRAQIARTDKSVTIKDVDALAATLEQAFAVGQMVMIRRTGDGMALFRRLGNKEDVQPAERAQEIAEEIGEAIRQTMDQHTYEVTPVQEVLTTSYVYDTKGQFKDVFNPDTYKIGETRRGIPFSGYIGAHVVLQPLENGGHSVNKLEFARYPSPVGLSCVPTPADPEAYKRWDPEKRNAEAEASAQKAGEPATEAASEDPEAIDGAFSEADLETLDKQLSSVDLGEELEPALP